LSWDELDSSDRSIWEETRRTQPHYRSPFFATAFCDAVQAARGDLLVAVVRSGQQPIGFLPFHRVGRVAFPPARRFNDAHDIIAGPETKIDWLWLLKECDLKSYDFHALVGSPNPPMGAYHQGIVGAFSARLGNDSHSFLQRLERDHKTIRRQAQKSRKMEREVGPMRLELDCRDSEVLQQIIEWKRQQYRRTNILDFFTPRWTRELVRHLHRAAEGRARVILSVLRAGDRVVAGHIGITEGGRLHYWFPTYDTAFARYSPGTALFKEIVRASTDHGIDCIDMGYGEQPYKRKQTDTVTKAAYGCITPSLLHWHWKAATKTASLAAKKVPMKEQLKHLLRRVRPTAGISELD
jgi:CelD/BcsL family acetyltransferase involved in cellulose biosynthesis